MKTLVPNANALPGRLPSLDGWRAISILMVLGAHSDSNPAIQAVGQSPVFFPLVDGNMGVRFFFVISGFIITYLLLRELEKSGEIDLKAFYARRALRILPVYFAYLAVVALMQLFGAVHQKLITWIGDLTFTINFLPRGVISGHLWSLSVEEQFYLIWPPMLLWLSRRKNTKLYLMALALPVIIAFVFNAISVEKAFPYVLHPLFHFSSSFLNFDALDMGCIAAFLLAKRGDKLKEILATRKHWTITLLGAVLVLAPCYLWVLHSGVVDFLTNVVGKTMQSVGFAMLLLSSVLYSRRFPVLNWRVVTYIGIVSYSIYIWQQIYCCFDADYHPPNIFIFKFPGSIAAAFITGMISYHFLESPLLKLKSRLRRDRPEKTA
jgi:peptidoglycan/LPS O-acetylase OafA/YrhL